jgi:hypothetical protein
MTREQLLERYFLLTESLLPADAQRDGWFVTDPQVFQRVLLDYLFDDAWENHLDRKHVAYEQLSDAQLEQLVDLAEYVLAGGKSRVYEMYDQSQVWRGKLNGG